MEEKPIRHNEQSKLRMQKYRLNINKSPKRSSEMKKRDAERKKKERAYNKIVDDEEAKVI